MKYWTLFTLRMMARVGLATALLAAAAGHWQPIAQSFTTSRLYLNADLDANAVRVLWSTTQIWFQHESDVLSPQQKELEELKVKLSSIGFLMMPKPTLRFDWSVSYVHARHVEILDEGYVPMRPDDRVFQTLGVTLSVDGRGVSELSFEHWFLCLTFLFATIATSVRWRKWDEAKECDE